MKYLKLFETYKDDISLKSTTINNIVDFMTKYSMKNINLSFSLNNSGIELIEIQSKDDIYYLIYEQITEQKTELSELPLKMIKEISDNIDIVFSLERILEIGGYSEETYYKIFKSKEKIEWNKWMFDLFNELDDTSIINKYYIQKELFTNYPETFELFMSTQDKKANKIILDPKIKEEFSELYKRYKINLKKNKYKI